MGCNHSRDPELSGWSLGFDSQVMLVPPRNSENRSPSLEHLLSDCHPVPTTKFRSRETGCVMSCLWDIIHKDPFKKSIVVIRRQVSHPYGNTGVAILYIEASLKELNVKLPQPANNSN